MNNITNQFLITIFLCSALSAGCAAVSEMKMRDDFSQTVKAYQKMIYWSQFEAANRYREPQEAASKPPKFDALSKIKITAYTIKQVITSADNAEVCQIVEIEYYKVDDVVIKSIRDRQLWVYDSTAERWYLQSGLPAFE